MKTKIYKVIGVMSGTSLDGIDFCFAHFYKNKVWHYEIKHATTKKYNKLWHKNLKNAPKLGVAELDRLDHEYTAFLSYEIQRFKKENGIKEKVIIGSHGHTVFHQPEYGYTKQIGNLYSIKKFLADLIVCNFRMQDVELGGQGAPLVPIGDELLFSDYDYCLNLGGFANISYKKKGRRIAYDICPANVVLNFFSNKLGKLFDDKGLMAKSGKLDKKLLIELNELQYYKQSAPKSLGIEWVNQCMLPLMNPLKTRDVLRTLTEHIAIQIVNQLSFNTSKTVLISGGGLYNSFLMDCLNAKTECKLVVPSEEIVNYKEALIFGFLSVLKIRNEVNCLKSVTGATKDHSSGVIYQ